MARQGSVFSHGQQIGVLLGNFANLTSSPALAA